MVMVPYKNQICKVSQQAKVREAEGKSLVWASRRENQEKQW